MNLDPKTILQVLVLAVGAHIVLSFLRTTRGSGLVRGVLIALFVVFGGLMGVARWLELSELQFILETLTGFVVVILAIVFQPELRRGIVSIGDNPLLRTVMGSRGGRGGRGVGCVRGDGRAARHSSPSSARSPSTWTRWSDRRPCLAPPARQHLPPGTFDGAVIVRIAAAMAIPP